MDLVIEAAPERLELKAELFRVLAQITGATLATNTSSIPISATGLDQVLAVLDALRDELGEERYRAAPLLRRLVATGRLGAHTGAGMRES